MRWLALAVKDVRDNYRSRLLATTVLLFLVVSGVFSGAYSYLYQQTGEHVFEAGLSGLLLPILTVLVPFVAVMATSDVIARKRQSGSIRVLLGLPYSRFDLVVGSFVGRTVVMSSAILSMAIVSIGITVIQVSIDGVQPLAGLFVLSMLLAAVFVSIGVGVSAASRSPTKAIACTVGISVCFIFRLWELVPYSVEYVGNGFQLPSELTEWGLVWNSVNPVVAYQRAAVAMIPDLANLPLLHSISTTDPYYLQTEFTVAVLFRWVILPVGLGYLRFRGSDL